MSDFTEADVEKVKNLLVEWFGHDEPTLDGDARDFLSEIVPAMRDRWLTELIAEANAKRLELQTRRRPEHGEAIACLASTERWLKRQRSGGDQ